MSKIKLKTPISYYGGKQMLCAKIISRIPEHHLYCEPFLGGAAVFFGKAPSPIEVLNDTNGALMTFYRVVQTNFSALQREIKTSLYSRNLYEKASVIYNHPDLFDDVKIAWAVWLLSRQSFGSNLDSSWTYSKKFNQIIKATQNAKGWFTKEYAERLQNVQLECADALYIIKSRDSNESFFYCDPPYYNSNCGHYDGYSLDDFEALLKTLTTLKGKFLLSSYNSPVLQKYIKANGWYQETINQHLMLSSTAPKRRTKTEVLTANYLLT